MRQAQLTHFDFIDPIIVQEIEQKTKKVTATASAKLYAPYSAGPR